MQFEGCLFALGTSNSLKTDGPKIYSPVVDSRYMAMAYLHCVPIGLSLVLTLLCGCHRGASGTYMAKFANGVDWLQLVKTPDNHLTGQYVELTLQADGKVDQKNGTFGGAIDGENVILSIAGIFGMQGGTLSGTLDGNKLTLTGPRLAPVILNRADFDEYQGEVKALHAKSQHILSAKNQQDLISGIDRVVSRMQQVALEADTRLIEFPKAEERYHAVTARVTEYTNRERELGRNPSTGVARSELDVAANQVSLATEELHNSLQSLRFSVQANVQGLAPEVDGLERGCRAVVPPGDLTSLQTSSRNAACKNLFRVDASYRHSVDAVVHGLIHLEDAYQRESHIQQGLLQAARGF